MKRKKPGQASTQDFTEIAAVADDILILKDFSAASLIAVSATNFVLLPPEEQMMMINAYAGILNSLSFPAQILILSKKMEIASYLSYLAEKIKLQSDSATKQRLEEYREFIQSTVTKNTILEKKFYFIIPFSPLEMGVAGARPKSLSLERVAAQARSALFPKRDHLLRLLKGAGLAGRGLASEEIAGLFYNLYNPAPARPDESAGLVRDGTWLPDLIAPSYVEVDFSHIKIDEKYYRTLFAVGYPRFVSANWLSPLLSFDHPLYVSMFVYPTQSHEVLRDLKRKIAEMEATIENEIKEGKVVDPTVQVALEDALALQSELAQGSERFFQFGLYITIPADSLEELRQITKQVDSLLSSLLIVAKQATLEMEEGFKSTLPAASDKLAVWRNMDTTSLATTFPFTTAALSANEGVLYGINQHDGSLVIFDRFTLENANAVVLGKAGGGKSFFVKLEAVRLLIMGVDLLIIDPENEYQKIAEAMGGEFVSFSLSSQYKINPFELTADAAEPDELANKILSLHSLLAVMLGDLTPSQDALLDRLLVLTYQQKGITQNPATHKKAPPLLEDLYKNILGLETAEAGDLASRLEKFVKGSAAGAFNQHSNFDIKNRFTVFGVRDIEENIRPVAMYIILDYIWGRIRRERKRRALVVDEAWYLIKHKDSAGYLHSFAKRARKYLLGLTTITQDVDDFLNTEEGRAIITNSSMQILLKQSPAAIDLVARVFNLTAGEKHLILSSRIGEGLFFASQSHAGIKIIASDKEHALIA